MIRSVDEIRAEYEKIIEARKHVHTRVVFSHGEYESGNYWKDRTWCSATLLGKSGKPRAHVSRCHDPIVDEAWFDDIAVLLRALDEKEQSK